MATSILLIPIGFCALMTSLPGIATVAMWCSRTRKQTRIWHFVTRGLLLIALLTMLLVVLPKYKAIFLGFGTELPGITVLWLQISDLAVGHFGLFSLVVTLAILGESAFVESSLRNGDSDDRDGMFRAKLCSTLVTGVFALFVVFSAAGVLMPSIKLLNDLS